MAQAPGALSELIYATEPPTDPPVCPPPSGQAQPTAEFHFFACLAKGMTSVAPGFAPPVFSSGQHDSEYDEVDYEEEDLGVGTSSGAGYRGLGGSRPLTITSLLGDKVQFGSPQLKLDAEEITYIPINVKAPPPSVSLSFQGYLPPANELPPRLQLLPWAPLPPPPRLPRSLPSSRPPLSSLPLPLRPPSSSQPSPPRSAGPSSCR